RDYLDQAHDRCTTRAALRAPGDAARMDALRRVCKRHGRYSDPLYRGEARVHEAALHSLRGDLEAMRRAWRAAELAFADNDQAAMLAAVRLRLAEVTRGREAAEYREAAEAYLRSQGIANATRFVDWLAPRHG
ncbi:MAG: hypothetical protein KC457_02435, partial [Myxococcales bacterium]|nr:hypothetical protein [Myxococcales bacterium]